ncbi:MAG: Transcription factor iws1 [Claussenomyces sp. TS43310]|nr:MAG: Transcription factor iws1 [Claussenomyces sp. TS43310]
MSDSDINSIPDSPVERTEAPPEDHDTPAPPPANPDLDMDVSDNERDGDLESELSEVDEAEFADFDPTAVAIDDRPRVDIDEDVAKTLKASKRRRLDKDGDGAPKKPKEGKRDKPKKKRRPDAVGEDGDIYDSGADGEIIEGKRKSKSKISRVDGERRDRDRAKDRRKEALEEEAENEANLTPEDRRRRALDRAMDAALKNPNKRRRKKDEVDLEEAFDDEIAELKIRMEKACEADNTAREKGQPAIHKLQMLPEVVAVLNRNTVQHSIVDPDTNFLQSVKFFLEPLNDGSLPAYNIQRDLFAALTRLPIEKEALLSSGIGKVVLYYTKSRRPEFGIKRTAERLLGEWSRPILKRSDDYKKRKIATRDFDFNAAQLALRPSHVSASQGQHSSSQRAGALSQRDLDRERLLAPAKLSNRARLEAANASYSVAPKSTFDPSRIDPNSRPIGASGDLAFRRMTAKMAKKKS